jgi:hypothetical protein
MAGGKCLGKKDRGARVHASRPVQLLGRRRLQRLI